ncbi:MAG: 2',3'-cyclic-nucleotide 2'-phosphodiesterase (5'-nucleotidase family) [Bacteroidia bacterium]|jgi:2',3'-cyclic-nucleotide 2'-phosphodiesterase (5'-nucleotidase family)
MNSKSHRERSNKITASIYAILLAMGLGGCKPPLTSLQHAQLQLFDSSTQLSNTGIDALIAPYKLQIDADMSAVVGYTKQAIHKKDTNGDLGNMVADLLLQYVHFKKNIPIDLCVLNNGGLRAPLPSGPVTLGKIYELMPFDNGLVVVTLNKEQLLKMIAVVGRRGEPIAGHGSIQLIQTQDGASYGIIANDNKVDFLRSKTSFRILTSDYLANGGDDFVVFQESSFIEDINILVRDGIKESFMAFTSELLPISAPKDLRIVKLASE